jgi:hypothetical protein
MPSFRHLARSLDERRLGGPAGDHLSEMRFQVEALFGRQIARHGRFQALKAFPVHTRLREGSEKLRRYAAARKAFRPISTLM